MDEKTKIAYEANSRAIAQEHLKLRPEELYLLARQYFIPGTKTLDLGCGSGRDTAWLIENGYDAFGVDYTEGFIEFAKEYFPHIKEHFSINSLPKLEGIADESFSNIFCSAVIQHIPRSDLLESIRNILRVLKAEGKLILSFRGPMGETPREADKLYENYHIGQMASLFESFGAKVLAEKSTKDATRDIVWNTLVVEKK